ncbi:mucoidy inhibitor MuiA family protein [Spongiivirga citrea]|uniref:Mucoidy inhibitor MuiA family protein n=1 Tax=Spongiivirga citrea TaxID=1481457 RepID=A0A6M0CFH1_9FLAO|nr:mucoidy inhibitor MuiA family protein [Spongiivirga citrea]NER15643.1 mucoidy inhibitor MuiA family protein [Spongiivirga citrea]
MRSLLLLLVFCTTVSFANDKKVPSTIKEVTVYLNGAQITRNASIYLDAGTSELVLEGLSTKIDESSIQLSGLGNVSILSIAYDINYLEKPESTPEIKALEDRIELNSLAISKLKNVINGLNEEENVIQLNRLVTGNEETLDLEKLKKVSTYYRERMTAIKNEIFDTNQKINDLKSDSSAIRKQLAEINNKPQQEQGEISIKFDSPIDTKLNLTVKYKVDDAGWIPNYDIKSEKLDAPLKLSYKAHVYQKTGEDWENAKLILSTGNPNINVAKPNLDTKYLNFVGHNYKARSTTKKQKYYYNPSVKRISGTVTDQTGQPLPGCSVVVKGTSNGTQTDFDGNYTIDVTSGQVLVFSYVGFKNIEQPIYSSIMNIGLEEDVQMLQEVVVTGYASGASGNSSNIRIRGASSYKPQLPLYIIDGVPVSNYSEGDLPESEIKSMEVLKGTAATSLYGIRASAGVIIITTKPSLIDEGKINTKFIIKKRYSIKSDADITVIRIDDHELNADYEYFTAPVLNENVFLTAQIKEWEKLQLLPGEANIYFEGSYAGKTTIDPYAISRKLVVSLGIDPNVIVSRKLRRNFKSKSFTGSNRILDRIYDLEIKNNKSTAITVKLMDRIPKSSNKEIKVDDIETYTAEYDKKKGLLTWNLDLKSGDQKKETFSYQLKYPRYKRVNL